MSVFLDATSGNPDSAVTWLLEPLRAASVDRWSGTLEHPIHADKAGKTIDAFMHFAYIYSQQSLVFADLQSKLPKLSRFQRILISGDRYEGPRAVWKWSFNLVRCYDSHAFAVR
jgi:hypothetical protein